eukprot:1142508-Pelagomonas_calceolata.AAC.1
MPNPILLPHPPPPPPHTMCYAAGTAPYTGLDNRWREHSGSMQIYARMCYTGCYTEHTLNQCEQLGLDTNVQLNLLANFMPILSCMPTSLLPLGMMLIAKILLTARLWSRMLSATLQIPTNMSSCSFVVEALRTCLLLQLKERKKYYAYQVQFSILDICRQDWFVPFDHNVRAPAHLPRHVHLDLSQHVTRNVSHFRLGAHTLKVETRGY